MENVRVGQAVEAPTGDGQADVLLERDGLRVGFEVSVTTPTGHEAAANLRKCLAAGADRVVLVLVKPKAAGARFRDAVLASLEEADRAWVAFLTPEELPDYIQGLASAPGSQPGRCRTRAERLGS